MIASIEGVHMGSPSYIEAVLIWSDKGRSDAAAQWFVDRGLVTKSMKAGLLIAGSQACFEEAFNIDMALSELPITLPVPKALRDAVKSIMIPKPREYQTGRA